MKPPGFASVAPAATTAIHGEEETALIRSTIPFVVFSAKGRRQVRPTEPSKVTPGARFKIESPCSRSPFTEVTATSETTNVGGIQITTFTQNPPNENHT